jgi:hypothetical protein
MKKTIMLLIALFFITSCAGLQGKKAQDNSVTPGAPVEFKAQDAATPVVKSPNYSGTWTGPLDIQGQTATLILSLVQEGDIITGTISDAQGQMGSSQIANPVLKDKTLSFSIMFTGPQGAIPVNFTGTFSEDTKDCALYLEVPGMGFSGNAKLVRS